MFSNQMSKTITTINTMLSKSKNDNAPSKQRLQDRELQEMSDHGMCLSMHQVIYFWKYKSKLANSSAYFMVEIC